MSTITRGFAPSDSYLQLIAAFPLRPLRNKREYKAARAAMERLAVRGEDALDEGQRDYLDGLDEFISLYDQNALTERPRRGTPRQRLRSLLRDSTTTPADLEKILHCSRSLVSLMLSGKRELSKDNIRALAKYFKLSADYFL
jgi:antitoxin component HigA of HigAB toxin-antitoxin module